MYLSNLEKKNRIDIKNINSIKCRRKYTYTFNLHIIN